MALMNGIGFAWRSRRSRRSGQRRTWRSAALAGLRSGDEIVSFNGEPISGWLSLVNRINAHPGESASIHYRRAGTEYATRVAIVGETVQGKLIGRIHVNPAAEVPLPPEFVRHVSLNPCRRWRTPGSKRGPSPAFRRVPCGASSPAASRSRISMARSRSRKWPAARPSRAKYLP